MGIGTLGFKLQSVYIHLNHFHKNVTYLWAWAHIQFTVPVAPCTVSSTLQMFNKW